MEQASTRNAKFVENIHPTSQLSIVNQLLVAGLSRFNFHFLGGFSFGQESQVKKSKVSFSRKKVRYNELPTWTGKLTRAKYELPSNIR